MTSPNIEDPDEYPVEFMGERPPIEILLDYNKKSSTLEDRNSESFCVETEE